jgi:hypothetical protein
VETGCRGGQGSPRAVAPYEEEEEEEEFWFSLGDFEESRLLGSDAVWLL